MTKKLTIMLGFILLGLIYAVFTLVQSKQSAGSIEHRGITDEAFLENRAISDEGVEYKEEQEAMIEAQSGMEDSLEQMKEEPPESIRLATGEFARLDPIHFAEGSVEILEYGEEIFLVFSDDFKTQRGPDLYVVLSEGSIYDEQTSINLGPLTDIAGRQIYKLTREEREATSGSVLIRCRAFDVLFSVADLVL